MLKVIDYPLGKLGFFAVMVAFVAMFGQHHVVTSYRVSGSSMQPSFEDGDRVIVAVLPNFLSSFDDGDSVIAVVRGETLIKRIVGIPGDVVEVRHGHLYRNGTLVEESIPAEYLESTSSSPPRRLGEDEYFLLGDHRRVSIDSREFGPVSGESLIGEVFWRLPGAASKDTASMAMDED